MKYKIGGKLFKGIVVKVVKGKKEKILLEYRPSMPITIGSREHLQLEIMR